MIEKLKEEFTEIYFTNISSTKGLEMLSQNIGISKNSMRRFLGKLNDGTKLRTSTLNLIAEKLGYRNYQDFCENYNNISLTQITQLKFFEISLWGNPKFRRTIFCVFW